jgi:hypothetical protein
MYNWIHSYQHALYIICKMDTHVTLYSICLLLIYCFCRYFIACGLYHAIQYNYIDTIQIHLSMASDISTLNNTPLFHIVQFFCEKNKSKLYICAFLLPSVQFSTVTSIEILVIRSLVTATAKLQVYEEFLHFGSHNREMNLQANA